MSENMDVTETIELSEEKVKLLEKKKRAREHLHDKFNKKYDRGDGEVSFIVDASKNLDKLKAKYRTTGIPELDEALGGGILKSAVTCIHGLEAAGKTGLAIEIAKQCVENGEMVLYICAEQLFPYDVAKLIGLDLESGQVDVITPQGYAEEVINTVTESLVDSSTNKLRSIYDLVIFDSINTLVPKSTLDTVVKDGAEKDGQMARKAKMYTDMLERLLGQGLLRNGASMILIAQERANMDSMTSKYFPTVLTGGKAVRYDSKMILHVTKKEIKKKNKIDNRQDLIGQDIFVSATKNGGTGIPKRCSYSVIFGIGRDDSASLLKTLENWGMLLKDKEVTGKATTIVVPLQNGDWWFTNLKDLTERIKLDEELKRLVRDLIKKGKPKNISISGNRYHYPELDSELADSDDES